MLSVLIPTYNINAYPLVQLLHEQCLLASIEFEINVYDDGSKSIPKENHLINNLDHCSFVKLPKNIGRSAIRNLLASEASFDHLLFVDAGTMPQNPNFIAQYLEHIDQKLVVGGMTHLEKAPKKPYKLRWLYTKKREKITPESIKDNRVICSSNFLIKKDVFLRNKFDESLTKYGCEDVIFFDTVIKSIGKPTYIINPVIHDSKDAATVFIQKTEEALENLAQLIDEKKIGKNRYRISKWYGHLRKLRFDILALALFSMTKKILLINFKSSRPSIVLYDFYRLGYYCKIKNR